MVLCTETPINNYQFSFLVFLPIHAPPASINIIVSGKERAENGNRFHVSREFRNYWHYFDLADHIMEKEMGRDLDTSNTFQV